jgi:predicted homoserine dehydrogenase-like protein
MAIKRKTSFLKAVTTLTKTTDASGAPVKIALLGFGTVGSSAARVIAESKLPGVELTHIFNRNVERVCRGEVRARVRCVDGELRRHPQLARGDCG